MEFIVPISHSESCIGYIIPSHLKLVVALREVSFGEVTSTLDLKKKFMNSRKEIFIIEGYLVQLVVVYSNPKIDPSFQQTTSDHPTERYLV